MALAINLIKGVAYYVHERLWNVLVWGRVGSPERSGLSAAVRWPSGGRWPEGRFLDSIEAGQVVRPHVSPVTRLYSAGKLRSIYLSQGTGDIGKARFWPDLGPNEAAELPGVQATESGFIGYDWLGIV